MLEVRRFNAFYGGSHIVQDVDLHVEDGARVALIGRNGVGKSTFLKGVMNAGPRVQGMVDWDGKPLGDLPSFRRARLGLCLVPEDRRVLPGITVLENLIMAQRGLGRSRKTRDPIEVLRTFPMLVPLEKRPADRLSGGQQQMLAVARAIVASPRLLLLDEPTEGLAPVIVEELVSVVVQACESTGAGLLLCEQNLWFARKCTDLVHVMDNGRIVFKGDWRSFEQNSDVRQKYLAV